MNKHQAIKLLTTQSVYQTLPDEDLKKSTGNYYTMYEIMQALGVTKEEVDFVENLSYKDLGLLD